MTAPPARRRRLAKLTVLVVFTAALAACGGGPAPRTAPSAHQREETAFKAWAKENRSTLENLATVTASFTKDSVGCATLATCNEPLVSGACTTIANAMTSAQGLKPPPGASLAKIWKTSLAQYLTAAQLCVTAIAAGDQTQFAQSTTDFLEPRGTGFGYLLEIAGAAKKAAT